jgi:hypothetical protein
MHRLGALRGWKCAAIALIITLAAFLRLWHVGAPSLWMDEGFTWLVASQPFSAMPAATLFADKHPPLHYWIEHVMLTLYGVHGAVPNSHQAERVLRLAPALWGVAGVVAVMWLGTRRRGLEVGLLAGLLLAVSPLHVMMSRDARDYSLADLCLILAAGCWLERRWVPYTLCAALALYSHYLCGVVLLWMWLGTLAVERDKFAWKPWALSCLVVALCFSPWVPTLLAQARTPSPGHGAVGWMALPDVCFTQVAGFTLNYTSMKWWWGLAALGAVLAGGWDVTLALVFWGTVGTFITGSTFGIFETRYSVLVTPFFCLLAATLLRARPYTWGVLLLFFIAMTSNYNFLTQDEWQREDWRGVAHYLQPHAGDVVLVEPYLALPALNFYLGQPADTVQPMPGVAFVWMTYDDAANFDPSRLDRHRRVWLVGNPSLVDPQQHVRALLEQSGRHEAAWTSYRRNAVLAVSVRRFDPLP